MKLADIFEIGGIGQDRILLLYALFGKRPQRFSRHLLVQLLELFTRDCRQLAGKRPHVVMSQIGKEHPSSAKSRSPAGNQEALTPQLARNRRGVNGPCTAGNDKRRLTRIISLRDG